MNSEFCCATYIAKGTIKLCKTTAQKLQFLLNKNCLKQNIQDKVTKQTANQYEQPLQINTEH